jgi:hypothetical protein
MGQIANQMAMEAFFKLKEKIKDKFQVCHYHHQN